jgi:excisionase family DNA binding protein
MEPSDQFMNVEETARLLSRTQHNIRTLLRNGGLKGAKIGARWYVSRRDLDQRIHGGG